MPSAVPEYTINQIAEKTGADRLSVKRWLEAEGIKPARIERRDGENGEIRYFGPNALKFVSERKKKNKTRISANGATGIDPETGLTWHQAKLMEEAKELRRENLKAEKLLAEEWMEVSDLHKILSLIATRLEQIPGKARSELGLSDSQVLALRRMMDEAREVAAKDIEEGD